MNTKRINKRPNMEKSEIIEEIRIACQDELKAVEFFEKQRWGDTPCCVHCGCVGNVYKMVDNKDPSKRNKRFLWRCKDCKKQYTVRIGTVYEESRIPLRHWCYAFWQAATCKKGVAALQIQRHCQLSNKSALYLMHRIRFAMADKPAKLKGIVEADETYVGGKPRRGTGTHKRGRGTKKVPVFGLVERGGNIHRRVVADVSGPTLKSAIRECVSRKARIITDEHPAYVGIDSDFSGGHDTIKHGAGEYARGDITTNSIESSFAIVKRGIIGVHHAVSKEHLHRYLAHYDFLWNSRKINDGDRTALAISAAEGKRLMYREPSAAGQAEVE
jgi:transposase-like protein